MRDPEPLLREVDPQIAALARHLWASVPKNGSPISNRSLRTRTQTIGNKDYQAARNGLRDMGLVRFGGGRSGSVCRCDDFADGAAIPELGSPRSSFELSLYPSIVSRLTAMISEEARFDSPPVVSVTGKQGRRSTGGMWSRPDITVVAHRQFKVLSGGHLEVHTYEVKTGAGLDISSLHEARAHRRRAHRSFVLVDFDHDDDIGRIESYVDDARELGIGLIGFRSVNDEWSIWYEPPIHHPDPIELDDFLATQLKPEEAAVIRGWQATPALGGTE